MASLSHVIRSFQSGGLARNEFFAQIDDALATDYANSARLLDVLSQEHTKIPLPPDVYAEVHRRIEHLMAAKKSSTADETRLLEDPGDLLSPARPPADWSNNNQSVPDPDRMKGVGDTLNGRFVLEECLGVGGMGTVYKALDLRKLEASDRSPYVAIKVLNVQFRGHPKSLIAMQREAKKAQTLAHPNIVTVYDFDRDGSMVYLTMEYLCGKPLSGMLRTPDFKGMPYPEALHIIRGMARALAYAHERGLVHCDFKPANVFLTDTGQVKVIDFGIARAIQRPGDDAELTVFDAGTLGGLTPAYASPEMLDHREPDPRDDIYALGCITYELLTGRHPFDRLSAAQARSAGSKPQRPKKLGRRQWRALRAALSLDRETRTPSVARFLQDMIGERRVGVSAAVVTSSLMITMVLAAALVYYWTSRTGQGGKPEAPPAPSAKVPQTVQPPEATLSLASVAPILASVPCSAIAASAHDHALQVQGYLPERFGIPRLKEALSAVPGVKTLNTDLHQVSDDKCAVIKSLAPYWTRNRQAGGPASIRTRQPNSELTEGSPLIVDVTTPGYDSYVNVDYYLADGNVVHLVPSLQEKDNQAPPNYSATIGSMGNWVISKPFGTELIVLLVTPAPLFDRVRPQYEARSVYLGAVEERLGQMATKYGPEHIAADFVQITTKARKR